MNEFDQPADEQNIPVLRTRNANIRRPTCKPNFLQTALCQTHKQTKQLTRCQCNQPQMCKPKHLVRKLTCRNRAHRHSRRTLRHIVQSRTPTPATQSWHKPEASAKYIQCFYTWKDIFVLATTGHKRAADDYALGPLKSFKILTITTSVEMTARLE